MSTALDIASIDFKKGDGLVPAIVQDADTGAVLMMAYMNREALEQTLARKRAVFFSRSKQRLWEKGETTGTHSKSSTWSPIATRTLCWSRAASRPGLSQRHPHQLWRRTAQRGQLRSAMRREARRRHSAARARGNRIRKLHRPSCMQKASTRSRRRSAREGRRMKTALAGASESDDKLVEESRGTCCSTCSCCCAPGESPLSQVAAEVKSLATADG
jgi:hypothetical protein